MKFKRTKRLGRTLYAIIRGRLSSQKPFMLSHLVTLQCNCRCGFCLWWRDSAAGKNEELNIDEITKVYKGLRKCGFIINSMWGGEPLVREDIPQIMRCSSELGFITILLTNGYLLPEKAKKIAKYLDAVSVSLDYPSNYHDVIRGKTGAFEKAVQGIQRLKRENPKCKVFITCVITTLNRNKILEMIHLAEDLGVSINFQAITAEETGAPRDAWSLKPSLTEEAETFKIVKEYKKRGHKINNSCDYMNFFIRGDRKYSCCFPKICVRLMPNGDIFNCLDASTPIANVRNIAIERILDSEKLQRLRKNAEKCFRCNDPPVIECSYLWQFKPRTAINTFRLFMEN